MSAKSGRKQKKTKKKKINERLYYCDNMPLKFYWRYDMLRSQMLDKLGVANDSLKIVSIKDNDNGKTWTIIFKYYPRLLSVPV